MTDLDRDMLVGRTVLEVVQFPDKFDRNNRFDGKTYILFDDEETYLELEPQDHYTYHDYSYTAMEVYSVSDPGMWKLIQSEWRKYHD